HLVFLSVEPAHQAIFGLEDFERDLALHTLEDEFGHERAGVTLERGENRVGVQQIGPAGADRQPGLALEYEGHSAAVAGERLEGPLETAKLELSFNRPAEDRAIVSVDAFQRGVLVARREVETGDRELAGPG